MSAPARPWLDAVLDCYCARRPVDATFIGIHDHDDRLPDVSENGLGDALVALRTLAATAPASPVDPVGAADHRLALGSLRLEIAELEAGRLTSNPSFYVGEAVFGVMSLLLREHGPDADRIERVTARLAAVPAFLGDAARHLRSAPTQWTARALDECVGGRAFFGSGIGLWLEQARDGVSASARAACRRAADVAAQAIDRFGARLESEVRAADGMAPAGPDLLDLYLKEGHALDRTAEQVLSDARAALAVAETTYAAGLKAQGLRDPDELGPRLASFRPTRATYLTSFRANWEALRDFAVELELVSWPDAPIRFEPQPVWVHEAAPHLYFLPYRSPSAFDPPIEHVCFVPPLEPSWSDERAEAMLAAVNDSVIRLNYVIHHGGLGHHVQNDFARRSPSRIGRIAAVDGASRIAFFCGGTMAEGWACYATDLMAEFGALSPLERLAEQRARIRMCARAIADVSMHLGRMTIAEAAAFYAERAGMPLAAARVEAVKNSMFPGAALMYFVGRDAIHALRAELRETLGESFRLRAFHDALLSWGSVPVTVIGNALREVARTTGSLDARALEQPSRTERHAIQP